MGKRILTRDIERTMLTLKKEDFKNELIPRIEIGQELLNRKIASQDELAKLKAEYYDWDNYNSELLKAAFNKEQNEHRRLYDRCTMLIGMNDYVSGKYNPNDPSYQLKDTKQQIDTKTTNLTQLLAKVDLIPTVEAVKESTVEEQDGENRNVFIIHGHDEVRLAELEGILRDDFKLNPYILKKLPNIGSTTIIEKFEFYAPQCSMAIALFTPDDIIEKDGQKYLQARPNVIYELGWFCAKLTRKNVLMLLKEGTDIFSDFQGILQIRFNSEISEKYRDLMLEFRAKAYIK